MMTITLLARRKTSGVESKTTEGDRGSGENITIFWIGESQCALPKIRFLYYTLNLLYTVCKYRGMTKIECDSKRNIIESCMEEWKRV